MQEEAEKKSSYNTYIMLFAFAFLYGIYNQYKISMDLQYIPIYCGSGMISVPLDFFACYKTNFDGNQEFDNLDFDIQESVIRYSVAREYSVIKEALDLGFVVDDSLIDDKILLDKRFLDDEKKFDMNKFVKFLKKYSVTEYQFRKFIEYKILFEQYNNFLLNNYCINDKLKLLVKNRFNAKRTILYSVVNFEDVKIDFDLEDLKEYYKKNIDLFKDFKKAEYIVYKIKNQNNDRYFTNNLLKQKKYELFDSSGKFELITNRNFIEDLIINRFGPNGIDYIEKKTEVGIEFISYGKNHYILYVNNPGKIIESTFNEKKRQVKKHYIQEKKKELASFSDGKIDSVILSGINNVNRFLPKKLLDQLFSGEIGEEYRIINNGKIIIARVEKIEEDSSGFDYDIKKKIDEDVLKACHEAIFMHESDKSGRR